MVRGPSRTKVFSPPAVIASTAARSQTAVPYVFRIRSLISLLLPFSAFSAGPRPRRALILDLIPGGAFVKGTVTARMVRSGYSPPKSASVRS